MKRQITAALAGDFLRYLAENEKSRSTIEKYARDIRTFSAFAAGRVVNKAMMLEYKQNLEEKYAVASANSMLAAVNAFLRFAGWGELCVRQFKVQKTAFCPEEKELTRAEYQRLIETPNRQENQRLSLVIQTICGSGIRVSELKHITVEAAEKGAAVVSCKGKTRTVFLVSSLRKKLLRYARQNGIRSGTIFVTKTGKPMDRSNIWREMKALCAKANVAPGKVFPHNLRHLFARTFYNIEKDIAKLADILGHSSINTTRIYIMTTGAEHKRRMEQMRLVI